MSIPIGKVRTRYAPSPTGYLHVGGAWMAFFNWLFARNQGGTFILRVEDTDRSRSTEEYERAILEDFRWLGIDWDEGPDKGGPVGPYRQTERFHLYRQYAQALLDRGAAYHCYCTPEELEAERQRARAAKRPYRYSGRCRNLTPKQWIMYRSLVWDPPQVAHLSNILGTDHKKLSKRTGDTAVRDYKRAGFLPEALVNFFALMAWYPEENREIYSVREMIEKFRLEDLGKASPVFDMTKLTWMNGVYMRELLRRDPDRAVEACLEPLRNAGLLDGQVTAETRAYIRQVVDVLGDRIKVGRDILTYGDFFFTDAVTYEPDAVKKYFSRKDVATTLAQLRERVAKVDRLDATTVESIVRTMASELRIESREIIHPARVALTGRTVGPGLFELTALLGRDRVIKRLDSAIDWIRRLP